MKRAVLCHCWGGYLEFIWYPYFKAKLKDAGIKVDIPSMPDTDHPVDQNWLTSFSEAVGEVGEDVLISGFGKFCVNGKRQRRGRNPAVGEDLIPAPRRVVTFKCSWKLRDRLNGN